MKMTQGEIFQACLWETQRGDETHAFRKAWFLGAKESVSQFPIWLLFIAKAFSLHSSLKSLLLLGTVNQGFSPWSFGVRGITGHQWENLSGESFNRIKFYSRLGVWPSTPQSAPLSHAQSSQGQLQAGQNCARKGQKWPLPIVTALLSSWLTCLELGVAFPFGSSK